MGKFKGMLFCTDLDGMPYKNDKTVSKQNLDAIEYLSLRVDSSPLLQEDRRLFQRKYAML